MKMLSIPALILLSFFSSAQADTKNFWVWDLRVMPPGFRTPAFDEMGTRPITASDRVHVWIERGLTPAPEQKTLDAWLDLLAVKGNERAIDPRVGAITLEQRFFGLQPTPPSGDRDIHVVVAALPPYESNGKKFGFDGYFNAFDQLTEAEAVKLEQHSNERDIIYVNALQDLNGDYMKGVVVHELAHLLTHVTEEENPSGWMNEMIGEGAMQMTGYFTDLPHVQRYRANTVWPIAVVDYGLSYGGVSLFAEYLMIQFGAEKFGNLARSKGTAFERLLKVYEKPFERLFDGYAQWLYEQSPLSGFEGEFVAPRAIESVLKIPPTGIVYAQQSLDRSELEIAETAPLCKNSRNTIRALPVFRKDVRAEPVAATQATAIWVESTPPCEASSGGTKYEKNAFTIKWKK